jgi:aminopeptidase N
MLLRQLEEAPDGFGRATAAAALADARDAEVTEALAKALKADSFSGVRIEAARALRRLATEGSLNALAASLDQPDARVRLAVVEALAEVFHPTAEARLTALLETETNPAIEAAAIRGLGRYAGDGPREAIRAGIRTDSHRQELAGAALDAARMRDDPALIDDLMWLIDDTRGRLPALGVRAGAGDAGHPRPA